MELASLVTLIANMLIVLLVFVYVYLMIKENYEAKAVVTAAVAVLFVVSAIAYAFLGKYLMTAADLIVAGLYFYLCHLARLKL